MGESLSGTRIHDRVFPFSSSEDCMLKQNPLLHELIGTLGAIVWEADARTFQFTWVSPQAEEILGYPAERWTEQDFWLEILHPEDRDSAVQTCVENLQQGRDSEFTYRAYTADGSIRWIYDIVRLVRDESGAVRWLRGLMVDVTKQKEREAEREHLLRREQAARWRAEAAERRSAILASAGELLDTSFAVLGEDPHSVFTAVADLVVPALVQYFRVDQLQRGGAVAMVAEASSDPIGEGNPPAPHPSDADSARHPAIRVIRSGRPLLIPSVEQSVRAELFADPNERERLPARAHSLLSVPLVARQQIFGALTMARTGPARPLDEIDLSFAQDLARRIAIVLDNTRLYDEAQAALRMRNDVLMVVSHDLRGPLGGISLAAEALLEGFRGGSECEAGEEWAAAIVQSASRMDELVGDLTEAVRRKEAGIPVTIGRYPASALASEAAKLHMPQAREKGMTIHVRVPAETPAVLADRGRILQVFSNLIGNAIRYSPEGGEVTVRTEMAGPEVRFAVSDSGPGITPEHQERIFERFWRDERGAEGGLGLGLAIAREILQAHGGRIWVESTLGEGCTFYFSLPRADTAASS